MSRRLCTVVLALAAASLGTAACGNNDQKTAQPAETARPAASTEQTRPDDGLIATRVRGQFFASPDVKGQNIDVSVDHGVVTLDGTVPTDQARQQAVEIARNVEGVSDVNDNLTVGASGSARSGQGSASPDHSPTWITTKVEAQLYAHPGVKPWNIDVSTSNDDVVTLSGMVPSSADHDKAIQIARQTDGVADVNDQLKVTSETAATSGTAPAPQGNHPGNAVSDAWITAKIQSKYFLDPDVKGRRIDVDTSNGVVTLRGDVGSYSERRQAASMARDTNGVQEVRDELRVAQNAPGAAAGSAQPAGQRLTDDWIETKVQSKFFIDSDIRSQQIDVQSRNGVVTLSGSADSSSAKQTAEKLARDTKGVKRVVDRIKVNPAASPTASGASQGR